MAELWLTYERDLWLIMSETLSETLSECGAGILLGVYKFIYNIVSPSHNDVSSVA